MNEKKQKCPKCGKDLLFDDTVCPFCGHRMPNRTLKNFLIWLLAALMLLSSLPDFINSVQNLNAELGNFRKTPEHPEFSEQEPWYEALRPLAFWLPQHIDLREGSEELEEARQEALDSLKYYPSSRQELIQYLTVLDYLQEDAAVVVDSLDVDYQEQALRYVTYLLQEVGGYSLEDLKEVLGYREYLPEEISYALSQIQPDWQEQAKIRAEAYLDSIPFSCQGLIDQLEYHGFSHQDAVWAADHCGADWMENAVMELKEQKENYPHDSEEELIRHMEFQGFTEEEIQYALRELAQ